MVKIVNIINTPGNSVFTLDHTSLILFSHFFFSFHWIDQCSSLGRALEHLESSGTKMFMNGLLSASYAGREKKRRKQRNIDP